LKFDYLDAAQYPFQQLWTVVLSVTQLMATLVTLLEPHLEKQPPTSAN